MAFCANSKAIPGSRGDRFSALVRVHLDDEVAIGLEEDAIGDALASPQVEASAVSTVIHNCDKISALNKRN